MMSTTKNKGLIFCVLTIVIVIIYVFKPSLSHSNIALNLINVDDGWGYEIFIKEKKVISQECIPAVKGHQVFKNKKDARKVGKAVIEKIKRKAPLVVTKTELKELNISCDF